MLSQKYIFGITPPSNGSRMPNMKEEKKAGLIDATENDH